MMTERVLPAISLPGPDRLRVAEAPVDDGAAAPAAGVAGTAVPQLSTPLRVGMLAGVSAAVYAVSLAGITGLQGGADLAAVAAGAPVAAELEAARAANDRIEAALLAADEAARGLAATYGDAGLDLADRQARLAALAALVGEIEGSAAAMPTRLRLPSVSIRGAIAPPSRSTTTGASGG